MNQYTSKKFKDEEQNFSPSLDSSKISFNLIPINPTVSIGGIPSSFLYGFQRGTLESRIRKLCFQSLSKSEQHEIYNERKKLTLYRKSALDLMIQGKIKELKSLKKPKTPVSQKLDNLVFSLELELTKKVVQNMSVLNKNVLEQEFKLLESNNKKAIHPLNKECQESQMIVSFFDKLTAVTEAAILERQKSNVVCLNQAS